MRETLRSRLGFLMLAAGCAVGLGNIWRFPFVVGQNGGAAFVLVYFLFLALFGFPLLNAELAIGRGSGLGISRALGELAPAASRGFWGTVGRLLFAGNILLLMYYTDVAGWLLRYVGIYASGGVSGDLSAAYDAVVGGRVGCSLCIAAVVGISAIVCSLGVVKGVERAAKWMMISLLLLLSILAVRSLAMPGAMKGVRFYLDPDWGRFLANPLRSISEAASQAFFTISVGVGAMTALGSYTGRTHSLTSSALWIIVIDTTVALLSGLIVFPACSACGIDVTSGPGLIFVALPGVFRIMEGGAVWGTAFFAFVFVAAMTTVIAVLECIIAGLMDEFSWSRRCSSLVAGVGITLLALPCAFFDSLLAIEDRIFSGFWLPLGAFAICLFVTRRKAWGWERFRNEASDGAGLELPGWLKLWMRWAVPVLILGVVVAGLAGACE